MALNESGTKARDIIYNYIMEYTFNNNIPPTVREIAESTGYGVGTVYHHLDKLVAEGKLIRNQINGKRIARCFMIA